MQNGLAVNLEDVHLTLTSRAGAVNILRGVSLQVAHRETVAILGPSGAGKSTLLAIIGGLEQADSGTVQIDGVEIGRMSESALAVFRRDAIGIVFQAFHLIPTMTAVENVAVPLELAGKANARETATQALEAVGLGARLQHYPSQLSGGEQQRTALARAMAPAPKLVLADEPTGNLDGETGRVVIDRLFTLCREQGTALILVSHDENIARRCDRVLHIADGLFTD